MQTLIGIDGGLDGGIAIWREGSGYSLHPMPTVTVVKGKGRFASHRRLYDLGAMSRLLIGASHVFLERARSTPRDGHAQAFLTGYGFGAWLGMLTARGIPGTIVEVGVWQPRMLDRHMQKGGTKAASIAAAKARHPQLILRATPRCRTDHDGMADALNILDYGRKYVLEESC